MASPDIKLDVKRPFRNRDGSIYWAKIGDVNLWRDADNVWSGQLRDYRTGQTFNVFENSPKGRQIQKQTQMNVEEASLESVDG